MYINIIALSVASISSAVLSAEKIIPVTPKLHIQQNMEPTAKQTLLNKGSASKNITPKSNKTVQAARGSEKKLQHKARLLVPARATKESPSGVGIKNNRHLSNRVHIPNSKRGDSPNFSNKLGTIKDANQGFQEAQNLRRFKEMQTLANMPGSQSDTPEYGSEHINPEGGQTPTPGGQAGQGRDCLVGGGNPADCFNSAGSGSAGIGAGRPGSAKDGVIIPGKGQASDGDAGTKQPGNLEAQGYERQSDGSYTRTSYEFHEDGGSTTVHETRNTDSGPGQARGSVTEWTVYDEEGAEVAHGIAFTDEKGRDQGGSMTSVRDGVTTWGGEDDMEEAEQTSPESDHAQGTDNCNWRPGGQGCTKRTVSGKEMTGQPSSNEEGGTGAGSVSTGVKLDAVINTGDGSYQASKHGGRGSGFNLKNIMPDSKPEPGSPVGRH